MNARQVVIAGAGLAGLMAAITAAGKGCAVTILEYLPAPGRKLLASGAGKCNFTNMLTAEDMAERFAPEQRRFVRPALLNFPPEAVRNFFAERGVKHKLVDDFYCFPQSEKASDILGVLLDTARSLGVKLICNAQVTDLQICDTRITQVIAGQQSYPCDFFIAAGGGPGFPRLGGRGSLDKVLQNCGVSIIERTPALCGLKSPDEWVQDLSGIVLDRVGLTLDKKNHSLGTLLFTGDGVSAPAALDLAGRAAKLLAGGQKVTVQVNFRPDHSPEQWLKLFAGYRQTDGKKLLRSLLAGHLPQALSGALLKHAGLYDVALANLNREQTMKLLDALTAQKLNISAVEKWDKAMASTGGADRSKINAKTMRSKEIDNLYFAGEFIDVDGPCGGYNLQWAFSSGVLAGSLRQ